MQWRETAGGDAMWVKCCGVAAAKAQWNIDSGPGSDGKLALQSRWILRSATSQ